MASDDNVCDVCGSRGYVVNFEQGACFSYACTAEVVVFRSVVRRQIKVCPDLDNRRGNIEKANKT